MAGGQLGEFGKLSMIRRLKPSKLVLTINNPLTDLLTHQTFYRQMLKTSQFTKLSLRQTFPLYDISVAISKLYLNNKTNLNNIIDIHKNYKLLVNFTCVCTMLYIYILCMHIHAYTFVVSSMLVNMTVATLLPLL